MPKTPRQAPPPAAGTAAPTALATQRFDDLLLADLRLRFQRVQQLLTLARTAERAAQALYDEARAEFEDLRTLLAAYEAEHQHD